MRRKSLKSEETTSSCFSDCTHISVPHALTPLSEISTKLDSAITLLHLHEDINQKSFHFLLSLAECYMRAEMWASLCMNHKRNVLLQLNQILKRNILWLSYVLLNIIYFVELFVRLRTCWLNKLGSFFFLPRLEAFI